MSYLNLKNNTKSGFTLVEMMVAIAVFSIVMVTSMSALLNVISANSKARSIKTAINNISFALEGISKDMRMGTGYACSTDGVNYDKSYCTSSGDIGISFKSSKTGKPYVYYKFSNTQLWSCTDPNISGSCSNPYQALTSPEVNLTNVKFYVLNDDGATPTKEQPRAIITVTGKAGPTNKPQLQTDFNLQTSVSQRQRMLN